MAGSVETWNMIFLLYTILTCSTIVPITCSSHCPTFPVKQENRELAFSLLPYTCELVVRVRVNMRSQRVFDGIDYMKGRGLRRIRNLHVTDVELVPTETAIPGGDNVTTTVDPSACPNYRIRNIGLLTIIDTIKNVCQLAVGVKRIDVDTQSSRRRDMVDYLPVFYYLEDNLF
ncbi:uncharacterized protein LOC117341045 [Pecten maximus]|uniref:uncharacterized protein LOC117341045 n=1 Tax=Pecten maximus TaxID=6579 RepID=UPI001457E855|nr:uncharacterized protein LOC117341045 [Pecten maximus]